MMETAPDRARLIGRLEHLVAANTENPPGRELEAARYLAQTLGALGFKVEMNEIERQRTSLCVQFAYGRGAGGQRLDLRSFQITKCQRPSLWPWRL